MSYQKVDIDLSKKQQTSIAKSVEAGTSAKIKLSNRQLHGSSASFMATKTQAGQIQRAKVANKGVMITLSKKQIQSMREGGFLPILLGSLVSALAPTLFNRLFPDRSQSGDGIIPGNGESSSYHIDEFKATGNGISMPGSGIIIPGTRTARLYNNQIPQQAQGVPKKKRPQRAGYINPLSENFTAQTPYQMLQ
jgi:hypothetical protein